MLETAHDLVNLLRRARKAIAPSEPDIAAGLDDAIRQIRPLAGYASQGEPGAGYDYLTDEPRPL